MSDTPFEKHQLAGVDDRERGFNRVVHVDCQNDSYRAAFYYEKTWVRGESANTTAAALDVLVEAIQAKGYTQLRSRLSFRGEKDLGSQEPWIEYPDPERPSRGFRRLWGALRRFLAGC